MLEAVEIAEKQMDKLERYKKTMSEGVDTESLFDEDQDLDKDKEFDVMNQLADIDDLPDSYFSDPEDPQAEETKKEQDELIQQYKACKYP